VDKSRKTWIDYIRVIAIFLVLDGHFISVGSFATAIPNVIASNNDINLPIIPSITHNMWKLDTFFVDKLHTQTAIVGVVLFLILTGYLSVNSRNKSTGKEFILKRAIRLYPVLLIATLLSGLIAYIDQNITFNILQYISTSLLVHPILQHNPVIGAVWVLCIEMIFYLILMHISKINVKMIAIINAIIIILVLCQFQSNSFILSTILYFVKFIPIILIGVTIKITENLNIIKRISIILITSLSAWGIIKLCSFTIPDETTYKNIQTYIVALAILFIFILLNHYQILKKTPYIIKIINDISYPIYLLQVNIGMAFMYFIKCNVTKNAYVIVFLALVVTLIISAFIHYIIEIPVQRKLNNLYERYKINKLLVNNHNQ